MTKAKTKAKPEEHISDVHLKDRYVVLKQPTDREIPVIQRVILCSGGFGCMTGNLGKVFGKEVVNGRSYHYRRYDFERLATPKEIKAAEAHFKKFSFDSVRRRSEKYMRCLLHVGVVYKGTFRVLMHKRDGTYRVHLYAENRKADAWEMTEIDCAKDLGSVLLSMNKEIGHE